MNVSYRMALLLLVLTVTLEGKILFWKKTPERAISISMSVPLKSKIPCDGHTSPEDHPTTKAAFSPGGWERSFTISFYQKGACNLDMKVKCFEKEKEGWHDAWTVKSDEPAKGDQVSIRSCYAWGNTEPANYILSGWYQEGPANPKLPWKQAAVKKVSSTPDVYEFADPQGGTARLEISSR
jgi:hypothetical protein